MTSPRTPIPSTSFNRYFRADCATGKPRWIVVTVHTENEADADLTEPIPVPGDLCPDGSHAWVWRRTTEADYLTGQVQSARP
jgi:hypothetical protein